MNILLGDFNAKIGTENIFKLTNGNTRLHEISNKIGVRVVNSAMLKKFNCQEYNVSTLQHS